MQKQHTHTHTHTHAGVDEPVIVDLRHGHGGGSARELRAVHGVPRRARRHRRGREATPDPPAAPLSAIRVGVQGSLESTDLLPAQANCFLLLWLKFVQV